MAVRKIVKIWQQGTVAGDLAPTHVAVCRCIYFFRYIFIVFLVLCCAVVVSLVGHLWVALIFRTQKLTMRKSRSGLRGGWLRVSLLAVVLILFLLVRCPTVSSTSKKAKRKKSTLPKAIYDVKDVQAYLSAAGAAHGSGDDAKALKVLNKAIELKPDFAQFYAVRASIAVEMAQSMDDIEVRDSTHNRKKKTQTGPLHRHRSYHICV